MCDLILSEFQTSYYKTFPHTRSTYELCILDHVSFIFCLTVFLFINAMHLTNLVEYFVRQTIFKIKINNSHVRGYKYLMKTYFCLPKRI